VIEEDVILFQRQSETDYYTITTNLRMRDHHERREMSVLCVEVN